MAASVSFNPENYELSFLWAHLTSGPGADILSKLTLGDRVSFPTSEKRKSHYQDFEGRNLILLTTEQSADKVWTLWCCTDGYPSYALKILYSPALQSGSVSFFKMKGLQDAG